MQQIEGKYTGASIFANTIEAETIEQVKRVCDHPIFKDCSIRVMPDCHAGAGCVIGFTSDMPHNGEIIPNIIGVDQSCGMYVVKLEDSPLLNDYEKLDKVIRKHVPCGFDGRDIVSNDIPEDLYEDVRRISTDILKDNYVSHLKKIGSLGGGNHFISIEKGETGTYLIIHSGSRNFGNKLAIHFQSVANEKHCYGEGVLKTLSYIDGKDAEEYLKCADVCRRFAHWSRKIMAKTIMVGMRWKEESSFETLHNYIGSDNIIRKGAISCKADEKVLIPLNMRDGSLICVGKGNVEWNNSGPHGAGRVLSRTAAREQLSMKEYKSTMEGIWTSCVNVSTIDESPMAYKNGDEIKSLIQSTATVVDHLKPVYNFKCAEDASFIKKRKEKMKER